MRILKLVIWDLDETILTGVLEEGSESVHPAAQDVMNLLHARGTIQALATHNQPEILRPAIEKFQWTGLFAQVEADLGSKASMVGRILDTLSVSALDTVFVDSDQFERDSIAFQVPGISGWSVPQLRAYLEENPTTVTEEGAKRPKMYLEDQARLRDEQSSPDYEDFLRRCDIRVTVRPFASRDRDRAKELLTRTHRMNLGVLSLQEALDRLEQEEHPAFIAEVTDRYGDLGRCAVAHFKRDALDEADIESLAISCRTRARGLSLSLLVGLLRHPMNRFRLVRCRYVFNGLNRPLRMLLMAAGFTSQPGTDALAVSAEQLAETKLPDWVHVSYPTPYET
jgi:FkbH-like protein